MTESAKPARIGATYLIETAHPLEKAATIMAGEQSSGTFLKVPGETPELQRTFGARVESITELGEVAEPSLPGARGPREGGRTIQRARVRLSFPTGNIALSLPNLLTMLAGNLYELSPFSGLRLETVDLPESFVTQFAGPQFGVTGTRQMAGVQDRPLIGTIIKPSVGLSPEDTAALVQKLCEAGLDFIKDDELIANPPYSPIRERVAACMRVINDHADRTGRKVMYAFNITDEIAAMRRHHDVVKAAGGTCVMMSLNSVGLTGVQAVRQTCELPIHGHRNGWGALSRHPSLGFDYRAWQVFWKLAGADHLHVNGLENKFCESDESVLASARACLAGLHGRHQVMPVFSSGQWARQAFRTYRELGSTDLLYVCGGGIMGHPDGIAAGVQSVRQAWAAAAAGQSEAEALADDRNRELSRAVEFFSGVEK